MNEFDQYEQQQSETRTKRESFFYIFVALKTVAIAQLVRASDCGSEGRGFEPH
jgi:hypothetical protein